MSVDPEPERTGPRPAAKTIHAIPARTGSRSHHALP